MKFSVITVCFNDKTGLERTIKSVVGQTFSDFEYIVIDGASSDGSVELIQQYADKIDYWVSEPDNGVYAAMNKGIKRTQGEYCIFMNSGDTFYSYDVLEKVALSDFSSDLAVGKACMTRGRRISSVVSPPDFICLGFWLHHSVIHQASFMRADFLKERLYDESLRIVSDWKYMLSEYLTKRYTYEPLNVIICNFDTTGISSNNDKRNQERDLVLKELLPRMVYDEYKLLDGYKYLYNNTSLLFTLNRLLKYRTLNNRHYID